MCIRSFSCNLFSTKQGNFIILNCNSCEVIFSRFIIFLILCRRIWCVEHHEWWARRLWYACNFPGSWGEPRYVTGEGTFASYLLHSYFYQFIIVIFIFPSYFVILLRFVSLNWFFSWSYIDVPFINSVLLHFVNLHSHAAFPCVSTLVHTPMCILYHRS